MDRQDHTQHKFFEKLVNEHSKALYALIRSMVLVHADADDVLQNTLIKAWKGLNGFRNEAALSTWLYRIAVNESLLLLRKRKWQGLFNFQKHDLKESLADSNVATDPQLALEKALTTLTPRQRSIFGLHYFNEIPFKQIAETLSISEGTAKATYHQTVKKMEIYIKQQIV